MTSFNPSHGFSASQSLTCQVLGTRDETVSIRRTDFPLPKDEQDRGDALIFRLFQSVARIFRFPKEQPPDVRGDGFGVSIRRTDFPLPKVQMVDTNDAISLAFQSVARIFRFPKTCPL